VARRELSTSVTRIRAAPSTLHAVSEGSGSPLSSLTEIERRIFESLVDGADSRTIASELQISTNEVDEHVQSVLNKLNVHARLEAATYAVRYGVPMEEAHRRLGGAKHPHLIPMDDAQLFAHVRRMHARGIPEFRSVSNEALRARHDLMHDGTP
jgi:DNA-binding CsgD family transcriptional regulator